MTFRHPIQWLALALIFLMPGLSRAVATVDEVAEIATKAIQRIDRAELADCPQDVVDRFPGASCVCGSFRGSFSALKFQLESNLSLQEFEPMVRARDAWTLRSGTYSRDLDVLGRAVTFRFLERTGTISVVIGEELPPPPKRSKKKDKKENDDEEEAQDGDGEEAEEGEKKTDDATQKEDDGN